MSGADMVRMKLIFWHGTKAPGEVVEVRADEVASWYGYAERLPDEEQPEPEESRDPDKAGAPAAAPRPATGAQKTPPAAEKTAK